MSKKVISTDLAPAALGPYSQAILTGNTLYVSGQIAIDPASGNLVMDSIEAEVTQVMTNLEQILRASDFGLSDVVKCSVFVSDMNDYKAINAVYAEYFAAESAPARELVEVTNLPKFVNVEISCIAVKS